MNPGKYLFIGGPTAVGKSEIALLIAEKVGGEIISTDSMQVYRGMDIGTAKPSPEERARVAHHLIDVVDVTSPFDAARFVRGAEQACLEIRARNRLPIFCGGTGLYFKAFLKGLGTAPPANPVLRETLEATPLPALLGELAQRDPLTYSHIDQRNRRRVVRALEVIRLTGKPFSEQRADWAAPEHDDPVHNCFVFTRAPADLQQRIAERVETMFRTGLVAETEKLLEQGLARNSGALQALGYRQVAEYLQGQRSLEETIQLVKIRTRQFAKRQLTWFRSQIAAEWIHLEKGGPAKLALDRVLQIFGKGT